MANGTWKIARGRGNAQLPLVVVVALALIVLLVGMSKSQSGMFDQVRAHVTDFLAPTLERVRGPIHDFNRWVGSIGEIFSVYEQNLKLKQENARLRQWRNAEIVLEGRVKHYQALLHAVPDPKLNAVLARVIGRSSKPFLQTLILDAGTGHNAKAGQAVVDASGMIGRIYLSGKRTSWVILLTDLNSRIPVTIAPGNVQAILAGDNTRMPQLDQLARTASIKAGDQVVSSGDGGLLPPGLPIGTVVADGSGGWRVALLADAGQSQDVEILNFAEPPEQLPPEAQLPVEAAGFKPMAPPPPATVTPPSASGVPPPKPSISNPANPSASTQAAATPAAKPVLPKPQTPAPSAQAAPDSDISAEQ
jgi:rod shape-determining protein MreC